VIGGAFAALARQRDWSYLNIMAQPVSTQEMPAVLPPRRIAPAIAVAGSGLGAAILLGTLALWAHYGTAVFFEMIASGISACF
jgi:hypothetical protein